MAWKRAAAALPPDQAADRRGRGPGHRRRHRDPAGHRHPRRRRGRDVRRRRGASRAVPAGRLDGAPAPPDPLHAGCRDAADRQDHHGRGGPAVRPHRHVVPKGQALDAGAGDRRAISANGPLAVKPVLRSLRETEGLPGGRRAQDRARARHARLRHQRRQGGPAGLRREAARSVHGHVTAADALAAALRELLDSHVAVHGGRQRPAGGARPRRGGRSTCWRGASGAGRGPAVLGPAAARDPARPTGLRHRYGRNAVAPPVSSPRRRTGCTARSPGQAARGRTRVGARRRPLPGPRPCLRARPRWPAAWAA